MTILATAQARAAYRSPTVPIDTRIFRCPECQGSLERTGEGLNCRSCGQNWPVEDGVPHFGGTDRRPDVLTYAQRQSVVRAAATEGWKVSLHDHLRSIAPKVYRQAVDEYRAQWRFVLPLSPDSRVLNLNCGWGAIAFNLAECCKLVVAADPCPARAQFVALRAQRMHRDNIVPVQLGLDQLFPFLNGYFDAVVLVDALSWIADLETWRLALRRVRDVLRPGGSVFLAEANRLGAWLLTRRPAGSNLHAANGYQKLLRSEGFREFHLYALAPSHLEPFFTISLDGEAPLAYFLREIAAGQDFTADFRQHGQGVLYRVIRVMARWTPYSLLSRLARMFVPSLAIVARA